MNLQIKLPDAAAVDARGSRRSAANGAARVSDDSAASFDGMLSDAGSNETAAKTGHATTTPTAPTSDETATSVQDDPPLEALMGLITQTQGGATSATSASRSRSGPAADDDAEETVDALLKRLAKKDEASAPDDATMIAGATTPDADPRLGALAALVAQIAPKAQQPAPNATSTGAHPPQAAPSLAAPADQALDSGKTTTVSDVTIETHLAPASRPQSRDATATTIGDATTSGLAAHDAGRATTQPVTPASSGREGAAHKNNDGQPESDPKTPGAAAESTRTEAVAPMPAMASDLGALRRIASAVVDLASAPGASGPQVPDADATTKTAAPARTLTLQMQPADLGTVDVRLHMSSDGLDLRLGLSNEHTLGMVSRERDTLTAMLQDQNYQVHSLVIQDSGGANASTGGGAGGNPNPSPHADGRADRNPGAAGSSDQGPSNRQQQGDRPAQNGRQPREPSSLRTSADPGTSLFV